MSNRRLQDNVDLAYKMHIIADCIADGLDDRAEKAMPEYPEIADLFRKWRDEHEAGRRYAFDAWMLALDEKNRNF